MAMRNISVGRDELVHEHCVCLDFLIALKLIMVVAWRAREAGSVQASGGTRLHHKGHLKNRASILQHSQCQRSLWGS